MAEQTAAFGSEIDQVGKIEKNDLEPILLKYRHGTPRSLFGMWIGANTNYVVMLNGVLLIMLGLSFWQAIAAVVVGNLMGCAVLGLSSIMGPRTGTAGIVTSRTSFGQLGAYLPTIVSAVSVLGWFSINSVVATDGLNELLKLAGAPDSKIILFIALLFILAMEIIVAIYGHATILKLEAWIAIVLGILFLIMFILVIPKMDWSFASTIENGPGVTGWGMWLLGMGIMFSYPISWTNFASDYSRYLAPDTSPKKIALFAGGGQFVALVLTEFVGICVGIASMTALGEIGGTPGALVENLVPTWFFVFFMLAVIFGCVATNVPNGYTAGLHLLALRLPLKRVAAVLVIAVITLLFRVGTLLYGEFYSLYQTWLIYIIVWTCPWIAIVLADYYMRRKNYNAVDLMKWKDNEYWYNGGVFWPGIIAFVVGCAGSILFTNSTLYASPLMTNYFGGADLSYFLGIIIALAIFIPLSMRAKTYSRAREMKGSIFPTGDADDEIVAPPAGPQPQEV
jgi:nucleobase:cation symporter-1, NCS1 family